MEVQKETYFPKLEAIEQAATTLQEVVAVTPLQENFNLSRQFGANIFLKREDLQQVRSYKIRGAYNKISSLTEEELANGIVCASAGNHAQGVALACRKKRNLRNYLYACTNTKTKGRTGENVWW